MNWRKMLKTPRSPLPSVPCLFLCLVLLLPLSGCAAKALPQWQGAPVKAQFSARVLPQAADMPLQGALRLAENEGELAVILQWGRTLGLCRAVRQGDRAAFPAAGASASGGGLRLHCEAAPGMGLAGQALLQRVALAVCRALPQAAGQEQANNSGQTERAEQAERAPGWRVVPTNSPHPGTAQEARPALQAFTYEDTQGRVDIIFSEVSQP